MAHRFLLAVIAIALSGIRTSFAADARNSLTQFRDSLSTRAIIGLHYSLDDRFRTADSIFIELASVYVSSPIGPLFAAGNAQAEMLDTESLHRLTAFERYVAEAEARAKRVDSSELSRAEAQFALGVAAGYRAVYESKWGGWFAAFKQGLRAKRHFQKALEMDSNLCDANLGLGTYYYWKSAKTDWINWLPIVSDERARGLELLKHAIGCGRYTRDAARAALASALINEGEYPAALAHADTLADLFPDARGPLWLKARAHYAMYEWEQAVALFDSLESRIRLTGTGNYFNLIECAYYRAHCHWGVGNYGEALAECGKALTFPADPETKKRQRARLDELRRMQRRLVKMLEK